MRKNALLFVLLALQHAHHKVQRVEEVSDDFKLIVAELTDCPFTHLLVSDDDKHRLGGSGFFLFDFERHYIKSAVRFGSAADLSTRSRQDIIANNSDGKGARGFSKPLGVGPVESRRAANFARICLFRACVALLYAHAQGVRIQKNKTPRLAMVSLQPRNRERTCQVWQMYFHGGF